MSFPLELALYKYFYEDGSKERVITELKKYQNPDADGIDLR